MSVYSAMKRAGRRSRSIASLLSIGTIACTSQSSTAQGKPQALQVPQGFQVSVFAKNVPGARSMTLGKDGTLYVGNREDRVYAVKDTDGDFMADVVHVLATGMNMPNGVAYRDGDLYVAEVNRILVWRKIADKLPKPGKPEVVTDRFPQDRHHGWKFIAFGPDDKLYVPVGAPCNICASKKAIYASITRISPDGKDFEIVAHGVRNSVGFDWHPKTKELWFSDNGRDWMGDNQPPCELNRLTKAGQHFGYPYCHGGNIADPEFGDRRPCSDFRAPARRLGAHVAPLGLRFYTGSMFPPKYRGGIFMAEHGSWNRTRKSGYRVMYAKLDQRGSVTAYEPFLTGFLNERTQAVSGRPVDVLLLPDGSLLVSDDHADAIYRVTYSEA